MQSEHPFIRDEVLPSYYVNALGNFLSVLAAGMRLSKLDATHIQLVAGADDQAAIIAIAGLWRWNEATVTRAHPGGVAGTYPIFVTGKNSNITSSPATFSDHTDYSFALDIEAPGATPTIVAGVVDVYRQIATCEWDGSQITHIDQMVPVVGRHAHSHSTGMGDVLLPSDIGAASQADMLAGDTTLASEIMAEAARAEAAEPTSDELAALTGTVGAPGAGNRYVTDADTRKWETGDIKWSMRGAASTGWHIADGSVQSQTDPIFAALFAVIGTTCNTGGEGPGNFRLPNFLGRTVVGAGAGAGLTPRALGALVGEESHVLATGEMPAHNHPVTDPTHTHTGITDPRTVTIDGGAVNFVGSATGATTRQTPNTGGFNVIGTNGPVGTFAADAHVHAVGNTSELTHVTVNNTGGGAAHNNTPAATVANAFVKL